MRNLCSLWNTVVVLVTLASCQQHSGQKNTTDNNSTGNKRTDTIKSLENKIKAYPDSPGLRMRLAGQLQAAGDIKTALLHTDTLLAQDSLNAGLFNFRGELQLELKDTAAAIRSLEISNRLFPYAATRHNLAYLYATQGNSKAMALCTEMIEEMGRDEPQGDPYFIRGIYFLHTGNRQKALENFNKSIATEHTFMEAYIAKGQIFFNEGKFPEALQVFQLAGTVSNSYADAYYWQGKCLEATGNKNEAILQYQRAIGLDPGYEEARLALKKIQ